MTALAGKNAKSGDKLADGDGLRLDVDKNGNASWISRFKSPVTIKERFMGLGPLRDIGLALAREAAGAARTLIRNSVDPIEHRVTERAKAKAEATGTVTFEAYAKQYIAGKEAGWKNEKPALTRPLNTAERYRLKQAEPRERRVLGGRKW